MDTLRTQRRRDARIGVALPKALRDDLQAVATAESVNISVIVRTAIADYVKKAQRKDRENAT